MKLEDSPIAAPENPELTVVMTAYNAERFIGEAIESILSQTFERFTFNIVNNGSTDRTGSIIEDFAKRDSRILPIHEVGCRTYVEGREAAIARVKTEWFALMDADDIAEPERLATQARYISTLGDKVSVFGSWANTINEDGELLARMIMGPTSLEEFSSLHEAGEAIMPLDPSTVIRLDAFRRAGGYRPVAVPATDLDLYYRIAETGGAILIIPEFLMRYRIHSASTSVAEVMLQRHKTHFVNYNMRRRRSGNDEVSWEVFNADVFSRLTYRLPRLRNDLGLAFYKRAGHAYSRHQLAKMVYFLLVALIFKPIHVARQLIRQKLMSKPARESRTMTQSINIAAFLQELDVHCHPDGLVILPLRNYAKLPEVNVGRDIDLVVNRHEVFKWLKHLKTVAHAQNLQMRWGRQYRYSRQFLFVAQDSSELEIDICPRFTWRGIDWLDADEVIRCSVVHKNMVRRPRADHEFFITLNSSYLHGGFFPRKYLETLKSLRSETEGPVRTLMYRLYGKSDAETILALFDASEIDKLEKLNRQIRIRCLKRALRQRPLHLIWGFVTSYLYDFWLYVTRQ